MFEWLRARETAERLGLRDNGKVRTVVGGNPFLNPQDTWAIKDICSVCLTRVRIGLKPDGNVVRYCYRCEKIEPKSCSFPRQSF